MDIYNADFYTAWDLNARRYVFVDKEMKLKARRLARHRMTAETYNLLNAFFSELILEEEYDYTN